MHTEKHIPSFGFTLIELSMVLVIIGLLAGGILIGRDLIRAAQVRAAVSQMEKTETAIFTFRLKYNALAGDIPNATTFWPSSTNGNGNGLIDSNYTPGIALEYYALWNHLSLAGLIPGEFPAATDFTTFYATYWPGNVFTSNLPAPAPKSSLGPYLTVQYTTGWLNLPAAHYFIWQHYVYPFGFNDSSFGWFDACLIGFDQYCSFITPADALAIDLKIDDGKPDTGRMISLSGFTGCGQDTIKYDPSITIPICPTFIKTNAF